MTPSPPPTVVWQCASVDEPLRWVACPTATGFIAPLPATPFPVKQSQAYQAAKERHGLSGWWESVREGWRLFWIAKHDADTHKQ